MPDPDYLARLARHLCRTDLADLPGPVADRARWLLADTVGCIAGGSTAPELQHLREALAHDLNGGPVRVIGTDVRAGATMAALLNGTAATVLEMAEGHNRGGGQNAAQLVPAALAAAESVGASGADLLRAVALGYEVGVRFGRATTFRPAIHPNGTVGAVAAAVAAACIAGADEERMALTIRLVSPLIVANSWQIAREGGEARNIATGHASAAGVLADRMAAAGLTAESDAPGTVFGAAIGDAFDGAGVVADWGDPWFVPGGYFKRYACGRYIHA
ncbi:MAG: MmgE/PrpD family protein, partial [Acetobacterales bacterium]